MNNGIRVDETGFANMNHDDQMKSLFHAVVTTNANFCKQVPLCESIMNEKIKAERKRRGRINIGLGSGGGVGAFGILEVFRRWLNGG